MFCYNIVLFTVCEVITYYVHCFLLHNASTLPALTRLHTTWAHANPCSSLQLYADHPLPLLIHHLTPILLPSLVLRLHIPTLQSTLTNSGYSVMLGIFLGGIARCTPIHYASGGTANFGAWRVLDWIHRTSRGGDVLEDARDEADKHHVKELSAAKVGEGGGVLRDGVDALKEETTKKRSHRKRT